MFTELISPPPRQAAGPGTTPGAAPGVDTSAVPARERLLQLLHAAITAGTLLKLSLAHYTGAQTEPGLTLQRLLVRPIMLRGAPALQFTWRHDTRDTTRNHAPLPGLQAIADLLGAGGFETAHMEWRDAAGRVQQAEYRHRLKGGRDKSRLVVSRAAAAAPPPARTAAASAATTAADSADAAQAGDDAPLAAPDGFLAHNRVKHRELDLDLPCWVDLGLATPGPPGQPARLVPAMARKWKQINRFLEVVGAALGHSSLAGQERVRVLDFGSGKGYLTFAMHAWLTGQGKAAEVTGVELRTGLVELCNAAAQRHGMRGLVFSAGDVRDYEPAPVDVMIALHACDTATDHAIHLGLRAGARLIVCSPCCHKQLRPQMKSPALLRPMLQHGIHLGQQAEMVTDSLRALLLDAAGYDTQVFEFVALEHTSKNKMILAVQRPGPEPAGHAEAVLAQVDEIKRYYGVASHCLQDLMCPPAPQAGPA
ncbi:MAG: hypothetical protein RLZZ584_3573 [Pseudomonadota bacterium]|jgi:SAM-dependent methyltransferase